jgi:hypothetical protein
MTTQANDDIKIVVLQRGWILVGRYSEDESGTYGYLDDANVIRYWGTTRGLGQLAERGPLSATRLDPCPTARFHQLTVIMTIDCEAKAWASKLR